MGRRKTKNPDDFKKFEIEIPVEAYCKLSGDAAKAKKSKNDILAGLISRSKFLDAPIKTKKVTYELPVETCELLSEASESASKSKVEFLAGLIRQHKAIGDHFQNLNYLHEKQREANSMKNEIAILKGAMAELGQLNKSVDEKFEQIVRILRKEA